MELAGALAEIANETLRHDFRRINPREARILLMEGGPRVLSAFPEDLSAKGEKLVSRLGVHVMKGVKVTHVDPEGVTFERNGATESLRAKTVLWAGGVTTNEFGRTLAARTAAHTDRTGRITVTPQLTIPNFPDIFVVGDLALTGCEVVADIVAFRSGHRLHSELAQQLLEYAGTSNRRVRVAALRVA